MTAPLIMKLLAGLMVALANAGLWLTLVTPPAMP